MTLTHSALTNVAEAMLYYMKTVRKMRATQATVICTRTFTSKAFEPIDPMNDQQGLNLFRPAPLLHLHRHKHWTFMAQPIPLSRQTGFARARHAKAMLLPIARQTADDLALRVHLALDALRRGAGSMTDAQTLTQTMLLTGFLAESGFGSATGEQLGAAERAVSTVFDIGRETAEWKLDNTGAALFAVIATNYDRQLHRAPLWAITEASERLDRFTAGVTYETPVKKRA